MADAVRAATTGHMRVSTTIGPTAIAALDPFVCAAPVEVDALLEAVDVVPVEKPEAEVLDMPVVAASVAGDTVAEAPDEPEPAAPDADAEFVVEPQVGAATAAEGLTSAPVPNETVVPSDCSVWFVGVLDPSAAAIVKRPVQVVFMAGSAHVVNW